MGSSVRNAAISANEKGGNPAKVDDANVPSADARLESRDQVLIAENGIQVGGRSRHRDLAHAPVDAAPPDGKAGQAYQARSASTPD